MATEAPAAPPPIPSVKAAPAGQVPVRPPGAEDEGFKIRSTGAPVIPTSPFMRDAFGDLNKRAGVTEPEPEVKPAAKPPAKPAAQKPAPAQQKPVGQQKPAEQKSPVAQEKASLEQKPAATAQTGQEATQDRTHPSWKLLEASKTKVKDLERQITELKTRAGDPEAVKGMTKRLQEIEARNADLENEIRYHNHFKSKEWQEKFESPWRTFFKGIGTELSDMSLTEANGQTRPASPADIVRLAQMPREAAKEQAQRWFGDDYGDVWRWRGDVQQMLEQQNAYLEKVLKEGAEVEQRRQQQAQVMTGQIAESYQRFCDEDIAKRDYLKPKEGDDEWNQRLEKAVRFVDGTLGTRVNDEKLTTEQREAAVRKHAAVRNRAVGFTMMRLRALRAEKEAESLRQKLAQYEQVEPGGGEGTPGGGEAAPTPPGGHMAEAFADLERRAK